MRAPRIAAVLLGVLMSCTGAATAAECRDVTHAGQGYTVCRAAPAQDELRLFLNDDTGKPWGGFRRLDRALRSKGQRLVFAMNAGMYHPDRSPVGHYIEDGRETMPVIASAGPGNFGMLPNGILCLRRDRADVMETRRYLATTPGCDHATQSGPMLLIDGALHPRFLPDSTSLYVRNGVGTAADGRTAWFVMSENPVTFFEFAQMFRDALGVQQALYLDGNVSRLFAPALGRADAGLPLGPMVGVVAPAE